MTISCVSQIRILKLRTEEAHLRQQDWVCRSRFSHCKPQGSCQYLLVCSSVENGLTLLQQHSLSLKFHSSAGNNNENLLKTKEVIIENFQNHAAAEEIILERWLEGQDTVLLEAGMGRDSWHALASSYWLSTGKLLSLQRLCSLLTSH